MRTVTRDEYLTTLKNQGVPRDHYAHVCPSCGTVQSAMSLIRAGAGTTVDDVAGMEGFSCVGRYDRAQGCKHTLGGFLPLAKYSISHEGRDHMRFEPASAEQAHELYERNRVLGMVEGRPVFKGDVLYVDIRGTCAKEWGKGQVAALGANEGQGPMIVFEDGDYRMCDRLLWMPVIDVTIPPEILKIAMNMAEQDNRGTTAPQFIVQQKVEYVTDEDYNDARIIWHESESGNHTEASPLRAKRLESLYDGGRDTPGWDRVAVMDVWEFVTACATEEGCKEYLASNGHNLRSPRIYAMGTDRNSEFRTLRKFLLSLVPGGK